MRIIYIIICFIFKLLQYCNIYFMHWSIFKMCTDHCMVDFIRPNLLGSIKEFTNRFINPINNGQYSDSTPYDVKLMKRRSHVLHKMLEGFVQVTVIYSIHICSRKQSLQMSMYPKLYLLLIILFFFCEIFTIQEYYYYYNNILSCFI